MVVKICPEIYIVMAHLKGFNFCFNMHSTKLNGCRADVGNENKSNLWGGYSSVFNITPTIQQFFDWSWRHGGNVGGKNNREKVLWEFDSTIIQNVSYILLLFWHQHDPLITWVQSKNRQFSKYQYSAWWQWCSENILNNRNKLQWMWKRLACHPLSFVFVL